MIFYFKGVLGFIQLLTVVDMFVHFSVCTSRVKTSCRRNLDPVVSPNPSPKHNHSLDPAPHPPQRHQARAPPQAQGL